jgi:outer membrane protein OmpA-like peptidoglycan-associated protein
VKVTELFPVRRRRQQNYWMSISDLMSGLMIIFLFVAVMYMNSVSKSKERLMEYAKDLEAGKAKIEQIVVIWNKMQENLYNDLTEEFKEDLPKWKASLNRDTLSIRFEEPSVFFEAGSARLTEGFRAILDDFFPRYLNILQKYLDSIAEVRIEGHTSSEWIGAENALDAYFKNMELSQDRTRSVLQYCLTIPQIKTQRSWAIKNITANGLSSSTPILNAAGQEDPFLSRRVEFRVRTDAEKRIVTILEDVQ